VDLGLILLDEGNFEVNAGIEGHWTDSENWTSTPLSLPSSDHWQRVVNLNEPKMSVSSPSNFFQHQSDGVISQPVVDSHTRRLQWMTWPRSLDFGSIEAGKPCLRAWSMIAPISWPSSGYSGTIPVASRS